MLNDRSDKQFGLITSIFNSRSCKASAALAVARRQLKIVNRRNANEFGIIGHAMPHYMVCSVVNPGLIWSGGCNTLFNWFLLGSFMRLLKSVNRHIMEDCFRQVHHFPGHIPANGYRHSRFNLGHCRNIGLRSTYRMPVYIRNLMSVEQFAGNLYPFCLPPIDSGQYYTPLLRTFYPFFGPASILFKQRDERYLHFFPQKHIVFKRLQQEQCMEQIINPMGCLVNTINNMPVIRLNRLCVSGNIMFVS